MLQRLAQGQDIGTIARQIVDALDPDRQIAAAVRAGASAEDGSAVAAVAQKMIAEALKPLASNPELRNAILEVRKSYQQTIDELESCGLAGTAAAQQHQGFTAMDFQIQVAEKLIAGFEPIGDVIELNGWTVIWRIVHTIRSRDQTECHYL